MVNAAVHKDIVISTGGVDAGAGNPHSVTRGGVCDAEIVGACRNGNGGGAIKNNILGGEAAVSSDRNRVLKFRIHGSRCISRSGQTTIFGNYCSVGVMVGIQKKLVTRAVFPHIVGFQNNCHLCFCTESQR